MTRACDASWWSMHGADSLVFAVQWNLSIEETIGTELAVLYREVSLIQR